MALSGTEFLFIIVLRSSISGLRRLEAEEGVRNDVNRLPGDFIFTPVGYLFRLVSCFASKVEEKMKETTRLCRRM